MFKKRKKEKSKDNISVISVLKFCHLLFGTYLLFAICYLEFHT